MEINPNLSAQESILIGLEEIYAEPRFLKLRLALTKATPRQRLFEILTAASELDPAASSYLVKMREALDRPQSGDFWLWLSRALGEISDQQGALDLFRKGLKDESHNITPLDTNRGWLEFIDLVATREPALFSALRRTLRAGPDDYCNEALRVFETFDAPVFELLQRIRKSLIEQDPLLSSQHLLNGLENFENWAWIHHLKQAIIQSNGAFRLDSLSRSQIQSKRWAIEEAYKIFGANLEYVHIICGWYGLLGMLMLKSNLFPKLQVRSYDIDPTCYPIAEKLHKPWIQDKLRFRAFIVDALTLDYGHRKWPGIVSPLPARNSGKVFREPISLLVNTSCEHLPDFKNWFKRLLPGTPVLLQSNNGFQEKEHINCVENIEAFKEMAPLTTVDYEGALDCGVFTRFMLIGKK